MTSHLASHNENIFIPKLLDVSTTDVVPLESNEVLLSDEVAIQDVPGDIRPISIVLQSPDMTMTSNNENILEPALIDVDTTITTDEVPLETMEVLFSDEVAIQDVPADIRPILIVLESQDMTITSNKENILEPDLINVATTVTTNEVPLETMEVILSDEVGIYEFPAPISEVRQSPSSSKIGMLNL